MSGLRPLLFKIFINDHSNIVTIGTKALLLMAYFDEQSPWMIVSDFSLANSIHGLSNTIFIKLRINKTRLLPQEKEASWVLHTNYIRKHQLFQISGHP
jgi:hypothetical protein